MWYKLYNYDLIKDSLGNVSKVIYQGELVGEYIYDAWGNCEEIVVSDNLINNVVIHYNPFRYKGYYYDVETNLYYVTIRYYNPEWGRWISPNSIDYLDPESINGLNLYAYCGNDTVNNYDPTGHFAISAVLIGLAFGFAGTMLTDLLDDGKIFNGSQDWKDYLGNTIAGGIGGLSGAFGLNMLGSMIFSATGDTVGGLISGDINSWSSFGQTIALSVGISILSSGLSKAVSNSFGTAQYKTIRGYSTKNIKVNNYLKNMTGSYKKVGLISLKIGSNSVDDFLKKLSRTTSNVILTELTGNLVSTSLGIWF